jgi:hypothetical protein
MYAPRRRLFCAASLLLHQIPHPLVDRSEHGRASLVRTP